MEDFNFDNQQIDQKFQEHVLSNLHLTEQQREQLGKASYQIGSYSGDGQASRTITVEGEIGFGLIFMVGEVFNQTVTSSGDTYVYAAIITPQGCSKGVSIAESGFTVQQSATSRWTASAACSTRAVRATFTSSSRRRLRLLQQQKRRMHLASSFYR